MVVTRGHVVQTSTEKNPYKVVLEHEHDADTEQGVETMREAEAIIKDALPTPPDRDTSRDRPASDIDE